jgi:predicted acyltransferase
MNTAASASATPFSVVSAPSGDPAVPAAPARLMSLDALRGFDMLWIVGGSAVVRAIADVSDNAGTRFLVTQLTHAKWEGVRFFDLIYPLFLFLIGIALVLSLDKVIAREGRRTAVIRIFRRFLLLYLCNFVYNGGFLTRWPDIRVASGVLAMIAWSYLFAGLIYCAVGPRLKGLAGITVALLLANWAVLAWVPFPDFRLEDKTIAALAEQAGSKDPAAVSALVTATTHGIYEPGHNLSNYLDYRYLPGKLMARYYENQGLLSPLTSVTLCLAGILAARLLLSPTMSPRRKVCGLALAGVAAATIGWIWGLELPVVKRLWTSSFCLVTAGYSAVLLAGFYLVVDIWKFRRWCQPLVWIGVNPITIYLLYELISFPKLAERLVGGDVKATLDGVAQGLGGVVNAGVSLALVLLVVRFLHERKIFLRL